MIINLKIRSNIQNKKNLDDVVAVYTPKFLVYNMREGVVSQDSYTFQLDEDNPPICEGPENFEKVYGEFLKQKKQDGIALQILGYKTDNKSFINFSFLDYE